MHLHEYQAKQLFGQHGIPVPQGRMVESTGDAAAAAKALGKTLAGVLLLGFPFALIFAWAFELTPEGVVRTEAVAEAESITSETGRKLDFALSFAIVALIIVIVWQASTAPEPAIVETAAVERDSAAPSAVA